MPAIKKRTVETIEYVIDDISSQEVETLSYRSEYTEFTKDGQPLIEQTWDTSGILLDRFEKVYGEDSKLLKGFLFQDGDEIAETKELFYDEAGTLIKETRTYLDGSISTTLFEYDAQGRITLQHCSDEEGEEEFREEYLYDEKGNKIEEARWDYGDLAIARKWQYNENNDVVRHSIEEFSDGKNIEKAYAYNDERQITEELTYSKGKLIAASLQTFNEDGSISELVNESTDGYEKVHFEYDEKGNTVRQEAYNRNGEQIHRVEREFDAYDNVIEIRVWMYDLVSGLIRRYSLRYTYVYFD